jgi:hypothetical protein
MLSSKRWDHSKSQWNEKYDTADLEELRAKAKHWQIKRLLHKQETEPMDWKRWQWRLQVTARDQFGDPARVGVQINQQINNGPLGWSEEELAATRKRLDKIDLQHKKLKAGVASDAELREYCVRGIEQYQYFIECLDRGETPDQEDQQQLYRIHEEKSDRQPEPIRTVEGHVTDSNDWHRLAIKDVAEPESPVGSESHSMRASDLDPLSGAPTEPEHVRQRDRKLAPGPPSERQWQRLEWEKTRQGGEGKGIF